MRHCVKKLSNVSLLLIILSFSIGCESQESKANREYCNDIENLSIKAKVLPISVNIQGVDAAGLMEKRYQDGRLLDLTSGTFLPDDDKISVRLGRVNFDNYKDFAILGNGVQLDIVYQSTLMQVNGEQDILHYGLKAAPSELEEAKAFVNCYGMKHSNIKKDKILLNDEPDPQVILIRKTEDKYVPVFHYEVVK